MPDPRFKLRKLFENSQTQEAGSKNTSRAPLSGVGEEAKVRWTREVNSNHFKADSTEEVAAVVLVEDMVM